MAENLKFRVVPVQLSPKEESALPENRKGMQWLVATPWESDTAREEGQLSPLDIKVAQIVGENIVKNFNTRRLPDSCTLTASMNPGWPAHDAGAEQNVETFIGVRLSDNNDIDHIKGMVTNYLSSLKAQEGIIVKQAKEKLEQDCKNSGIPAPVVFNATMQPGKTLRQDLEGIIKTHLGNKTTPETQENLLNALMQRILNGPSQQNDVTP